ncbi:aldo/keto reductase [Sphingobium sp.]|uniref:aldo/keto reductase n=1 Tax=Sphingobium sp. TaxID=1912891 RepID=UPI0025EA6960|nr:aldo/keto reductase [Sphingobium sp.]
MTPTFSQPLALDTYRLLGRSGLRVSPLALGTMTFGEEWGGNESESRRIFDAYVECGGNFIDTAGYYADGVSETLTGKFAETKRERLVLSTKYSLTRSVGDPNAAGNSRRNMVQTVETSLRRLRTDRIDLFFLHVWDDTTPADEILRAFDDLVSQGKILYLGLSDTPAWQMARLQTMAELRGWSQFVALQAEYNLIERTAERDLIPAARALGIGVMPWSPLASGMLSGKYATGGSAHAGEAGGRKAMLEAADRIDARVVAIADAVKATADELGVTSAQVAIAWTLANSAVISPLVGARTMRQYEDNVAALGVSLDGTQLERLNAASAISLGFPHDFLATPFIRHGLTGGTTIHPRH